MAVNHPLQVRFLVRAIFNFIHFIKPTFSYVQKNNYLVRKHRFNYRKDILLKEIKNNNILQENKAKKMTEWELAQLLNFDRIWDCGKLKFEMNL